MHGWQAMVLRETRYPKVLNDRLVTSVKVVTKRLSRRVVYRLRKTRLFYFWNYNSDRRRYLAYSAVAAADTRTKLRARLIRQYHILEKGLALRDPSGIFDRFRVGSFLADIRVYLATYGPDETSARALQAFIEVRDHPSTPDPPAEVNEEIEELLAWEHPDARPSTIHLSREEVHACSRMDLSKFFWSRHSIRQFDPTPVSLSLIEQAAQLAQRTPSVCNRQAWQIHVLEDPLLRRRALELQGGNEGFGREADKALMITCDIGHYLRIGERHQAWVDGGMLGMSLVYALHSLGLGTCCLNWGKDRWDDLRAKRALGLSDGETIIMLMLVGHLPAEFSVAASERKDLGELVIVHSTSSNLSDGGASEG